MEIILLAAGCLIFILSFFIPDGKSGAEGRKQLSEDEMNALLAKELTAVRGHVDDLVQEAVEDVMEKTERSLEKLSNEKIMAISEYSDTVLEEIHKNHEEVLFLYDMLNNKHISIKGALGEINNAVQTAEKTAESLGRLTVDAESGNGNAGEEAENSVKYSIYGDALSIQEGYREAAQAESRQSLAESESITVDEEKQDLGADSQERNNNVRILELYRQGKTIVDIARELSLGVGEVKLVVDLFKNQ